MQTWYEITNGTNDPVAVCERRFVEALELIDTLRAKLVEERNSGVWKDWGHAGNLFALVQTLEEIVNE